MTAVNLDYATHMPNSAYRREIAVSDSAITDNTVAVLFDIGKLLYFRNIV